jgi:hemoglobin/transferrin/lactoferrin receptor protein
VAATVDACAQDETVLDPISIFATLSPISAFDYPGQVSVVQREEIQTQQANVIGDVLKNVPGVFVDGGPRSQGQVPTIRGFREEDILILVDGVKQSFISGHDGRIFIEPDLLKTVEIVKGPISSLYGSGAIGGVIALTTVDAADFLAPGETAGVRFKIGHQSVNDEMAYSTTAFARSKDGVFDVVASITYRESGDIDLGNGFSLPNEEEITASLLKGTVQLAPDLKFTAAWTHYQNDGVNPNNPQGNNVSNPGAVNPNPDVNRTVESDSVYGKLSFAPTGNPLVDANLLVYFSRHVNEEDDTTTTRFTSREVETTGVKLDNRSRFTIDDATKLTLTYGAEYYVDDQTGTDNSPVPLANGTPQPKNVPDAKSTFYGAFAQAELTINQPAGLPGEFTLLPGVRWDGFENNYNDTEDYDDFKDQAVSPKIGAAYKPAPWLLVFGNYGEAFRAPSYTELYAQGTHFRFSTSPLFLNNIFISNPNLKPQTGVTLEGGIGFDFKDVATSGDRLTVKGSYWTTDAQGYIDLDVVTSGCIPQFGLRGPIPGSTNQAQCFSQFNNKDAELDGVEVELRYDSSRIFASASYQTIDGKDMDTGLFLGSLYADRVILDAGVKLPEIWSRFGARFTFADQMDKVNPEDEDNNPSTPDTRPIRDAYNLIDLYAVIEPTEGPLKGFRLDLGVDNITDEAYELIEKGVFEEGINYKAAVSWAAKW